MAQVNSPNSIQTNLQQICVLFKEVMAILKYPFEKISRKVIILSILTKLPIPIPMPLGFGL